MAQEKKYKLLEEVARCSGYDIALMTTFNFDIKYFERAILNPLYARGLKKISIFVDAKELTESIKHVENCHLGRKYMVNPIEMNGSFHPKLVLLLGEKKARLFVGSANLTASGYTTNNEIFNFFDYTAKNPENLDIINAAISFFVEINNLSYKQDSELIREAVRLKYYKKPEQTGDSILLYNTKTSILNQVAERITQKVKEINVIVPYYDTKLSALKALKETFPGAKAHLYLFKYLNTFPTEINNIERITNVIDVFENFHSNTSYSSNNFYHGKVFIFKCDNADYVLYGSANCTQSALIKTLSDDGNIECDCFEKGVKGEFDYFIDNLHISDDDEYTSRPLTYESEPNGCFSYKYGKYENGMQLHFGFRKKQSDITAKLFNTDLETKYTDTELVVSVPAETAQLLTTIFDVTLTYGNHTETVRCWVYVPSELDNNRYSTLVTDTLEDVDIDSSGDKFAEDYTKLIEAMNSCAADFEENSKKIAMRNILQQEIEGDDVIESAEGEDFIVEDTISDEARFEYRRFDAIDRFRRQFLRRFLFGQTSVFFSPRIKNDSTKKESDKTTETEQKKPRKATTAEKRFERFVKRRVKEIFNPAYINIISVEHYVGIMEVVFEIFRKYNNDDPVEDIFDIDYVIDTRIEFYEHLLSKDLKDTESLPNLEETVLTNCFAAIIENRAIDDSEETEYVNRSFLTLLEKKYQLRDDYKEYINKAIERNDAAVVQKGYDISCDYIDMLYGYKSNNQLSEYITKVYKGARVEINGKILKIEVTVPDINIHGVPNKDVLAEIVKYSYKYGTISTVFIDITNGADIRMCKNIRTHIKHTIRMESHQLVSETEYKNGIKDKSKSRYFDF